MGETEPKPAPLEELSARVAFFLRELVDWNDPGPEATETRVRHLTYVAYYFNTLAVAGYGGRVGNVRDEGLVEQVVTAAFQTFEGYDPYPGHFVGNLPTLPLPLSLMLPYPPILTLL